MSGFADAFSRAASTYESEGLLQKEISISLLNKLPAGINAELILDAGCGSGYFSSKIAESFPAASVDAVDAAGGMITEAKRLHHNERIKFTQQDFTLLKSERLYDVVFSSSALQWCENPQQAWMHLFSLVKPGGYLAVSLFLDGTWKEMKKAAYLEGYDGALMELPSASECLLWQTEKDLRVISQSVNEKKLFFKNWSAFSKYQKKTGTSASSSGIELPLLRKIMNKISDGRPDGFELTCEWAELCCRKNT